MELGPEAEVDSYLQTVSAHWALMLVIVRATVAGAIATIALHPCGATAKLVVSALPILLTARLRRTTRVSVEQTRDLLERVGVRTIGAGLISAASRLPTDYRQLAVEGATGNEPFLQVHQRSTASGTGRRSSSRS